MSCSGSAATIQKVYTLIASSWTRYHTVCKLYALGKFLRGHQKNSWFLIGHKKKSTSLVAIIVKKYILLLLKNQKVHTHVVHICKLHY
jgi:hypothetical protein